jgi:polyphosphate kinase
MILKNNSINDKDIILKLEQASCAGVRVDMIVRGICCVLAEVPGRTENLHIRSLVGRYLEHGRIYSFFDGEQTRLYIASGDFLTRNTECRVEVGVRIRDPALVKKLTDILELQLRDNVNAREMRADGSYQKVKPQPGEAAVNSQMAMYALLQDDWAGTGSAAPKPEEQPEPEKAPEQVQAKEPEKVPEKVQAKAPEKTAKPQPAPRPAPRVTVKQQTWLERLWGRLGRK